MAIYYSILYPPIVPLSHPAFELTKPEDTFRIYFEPSVGNKISEFSGGFIRIRNAETEKNALLPIGDGYIDGFIPFRNPFAEHIDLIDPSKNILQPEGYNPTLPFVQQNERNEYFIDLKQEAFTLSGSQKDIRYKLQIMVTRDWVSSTADNGRGNILVYKDDQVNPGYQRIDTSQYFGGNLIQKGLSEWSSNTLIAPVSIANYELQIDGNNIFSPIVEFVGSTVDDNIRNNTMANYLKAYRINIYKAFEGRKYTFVDSSNWIIGQEASNLEIRWQNKVEFENKENYIIELDIQTAWDLRKTFTYYVYTQFEASLFNGSVKVLNDHDYARSKIIMNIQTPLQWGPRDNFDISTDDRDYAVISDEAFVQEGIDFFSDRGSLAGEMLIKGIDPIRNWHENDKRWFFKLKGPEITDKNHFQEVYSMYAHCIPLGKDKENDGPYTDDIIINPVIESPTGEVYKTYVDSSRTPEPHYEDSEVSPKDTIHKIINDNSVNLTTEIHADSLSPNKNLMGIFKDSVWQFDPSTLHIKNNTWDGKNLSEITLPAGTYSVSFKTFKKLTSATTLSCYVDGAVYNNGAISNFHSFNLGTLYQRTITLPKESIVKYTAWGNNNLEPVEFEMKIEKGNYTNYSPAVEWVGNDGYVPIPRATFMATTYRNNPKGRFKFFIPDEYNKISNITAEFTSEGRTQMTLNNKVSGISAYQNIEVQKTDMKNNIATIDFEGVDGIVNFGYAQIGYDYTVDAAPVNPLLSDIGGVVTMRSTLPSSHTYFYLEDDNNQLWRTTITPAGEFVTDISHEKDPMEFLKPVYFWDSHTRTLVKPVVDTKGVIDLSIASENYNLEDNARPPYINEFRFVKEIYALELGRKVKILKQTYKAYMTDFNRKLGKWHKISRDRKYYIYFSASEGQIQLVVRDLSASDLENGFDRFTLTYTGGANIGVKSDMFLTTTGVNKDFLEPKKDDGSPLPYTITSGETGILTNDLGYISASTSTSRSLRESDVEEMRNKGEIEE